MSLQHALLVSLAEHEASGYDLTRRFDRSVGFFWSATHQQIYRVLAKMAEGGLVDARVEPGEGKPDRRVYSLTEVGRRELRAWSATPTPTQQLRSEFAVKVRGMPHGDSDAVLDDIRRQRAAHVEQLAYYEANAAKNFPDVGALDAAQRPLYAVLRGGILTERAMIEWCDEMLALLAPEAAASATSVPQVEMSAASTLSSSGRRRRSSATHTRRTR